MAGHTGMHHRLRTACHTQWTKVGSRIACAQAEHRPWFKEWARDAGIYATL